MNSQLGHIASLIPRAAGNLMGKTEENPKGHHIAAMNLRSGKKMQEPKGKTAEEEIPSPELVPDGTSPMPDNTHRRSNDTLR